MITTKEEIRNTVYKHLYGLYSRFAMECYPYLTKELASIISMTAYNEMIQMAQGNYLIDYYNRLMKGAV